MGWNKIEVVTCSDSRHRIWIAAKCIGCGKVAGKHRSYIQKFNIPAGNSIKLNIEEVLSSSYPPEDNKFS